MNFKLLAEEAVDRPSSHALMQLATAGRGADEGEIAHLARALATSGTMLEQRPDFADVVSTGGPGSLSTLYGPLLLLEAGFEVPKLGVPGRPAGALDTLGSLAGYRVTLNRSGVEDVLDLCGWAHFAAGGDFAPADAELFELRQRMGLQAEPALVIASLLAKKLAAGVTRFAVDARIGPHGNFGSSARDAQISADRLKAVASSMGMEAFVTLTSAAVPAQPFIGRGEALLALWLLLEGRAEGALAEHGRACERMVAELLGNPGGSSSGVSMRRHLDRHLEAQGSSPAVFEERVQEVRDAKLDVLAVNHGGVLKVDMFKVRAALVAAQCANGSSRFADPAGVLLDAMPGSLVTAAQPVLSVRSTARCRSKLLHDLREAIVVTADGGPSEAP